MKPYATGLGILVASVAGVIFFAATRREGAAPKPSQAAIETPAVVPQPVEALPSESSAPLASTEAALLQPPADEPSAPPPAAASFPSPATPPAEKSPYAKILIPAGQPVPELFPFQSERETISALAGTYDARKIPAIAAYLRHSDSTVRQAARDGLVQMGDEKAVPYIEEAAKNTTDPAEAERLREAAEFLSLPSFVDIVLPKYKKNS